MSAHPIDEPVDLFQSQLSVARAALAETQVSSEQLPALAKDQFIRHLRGLEKSYADALHAHGLHSAPALIYAGSVLDATRDFGIHAISAALREIDGGKVADAVARLERAREALRTSAKGK